MGRRVIYEYAVERGSFTLGLPVGAQFLDVQIQGTQPVMWFCLDPESREQPCGFTCVGTGEESPDGARYLGTFQMPDGLVYHLFGNLMRGN